MSNGHDLNYEAGVDRELNLKSIVVTGLVLAIVVVASAVAVWWISKGLRSELVRDDAPPPVLFEAQIQEPPPEPRLQTDPEDDLFLMRIEESLGLDNYAWVDEAGGIARVPIERAMEILAEDGWPEAELQTAAEGEPAPTVAPGGTGE